MALVTALQNDSWGTNEFNLLQGRKKMYFDTSNKCQGFLPSLSQCQTIPQGGWTCTTHYALGVTETGVLLPVRLI